MSNSIAVPSGSIAVNLSSNPEVANSFVYGQIAQRAQGIRDVAHVEGLEMLAARDEPADIVAMLSEADVQANEVMATAALFAGVSR